jgi:cytochrome c553
MTKHSLLLSLLLVAGSAHAQEPAPDLEKARQTAETNCVACHMVDGNSELPDYPKIAGQNADYLFKQMKEFKNWDGKPAGRENAFMGAMISPLEEADMKAMAAYFSGQTLKPAAAKQPDTVATGQKIWRAGIVKKGVPACAACHGPAGKGLPALYPALAGQFPEYLETQLRAFRDGTRKNDPAAVMQDIALRLTEPEIKAVSDYAAGLR